MRRCKIPPSACRHPSATPCCLDCRDTGCAVRCENHPDRCGCWEDRPPRRARARKVSELTVAYLYAQGVSQKDIAWRLGCCPSTVCNILRESGVTGHGDP